MEKESKRKEEKQKQKRKTGWKKIASATLMLTGIVIQVMRDKNKNT